MDANGAKKDEGDSTCNDMRHLGTSYKFDCMFIVGSGANKESVLGCKYLFSIESPVFERMLLGDFLERKTCMEGIPLPEDDPKTVRHFRLLACSSERVSRMEGFSVDDTLNLMQFCHKYMALSISNLCTERLMRVCETAPIGHLIKMFAGMRNFPETPLYEKVKTRLKAQNYPLQPMPNDINQDGFMDYLCCYFELHSTNYSALVVFTTIEKYLKHNDLIPTNLLDDEEINLQSNDKNNPAAPKIPNKTVAERAENLSLQSDKMKLIFLRDLLKKIDFSKMETNSFISGPSTSDLLTLDQKYNILINICKKKSPIKLFEN